MQVQRSTTRRAEAPTSNSRLSALNLYSRPPTEDVGLSEFEEFAFDRLRLLSAIENARAKGLKGDDLKKTIGKARDEYMPVTEEGLRKDYVSHFILRLAYCRSEDLRRWFLQNEVELFKWRFVNNPPVEGMNRWLQANGMKYEAISGEEQRALQDELTQVLQAAFDEKGGKKYADKDARSASSTTRSASRRCSTSCASGRRCSAAGTPTCPLPTSSRSSPTRCGCTSRSSCRRSRASGPRSARPSPTASPASSRASPTPTSARTTRSRATAARRSRSPSLPALARRSMPLCMSNMYHKLAETHHLKHSARKQFGLFLKGIGLTVDESMAFWRSEFTKRPETSVEKFQKEYAYGVRYNYGLEGKRQDWSPWSCMKSIIASPGANAAAGEHHGCPFRNFDEGQLRATLQQMQVGPAEANFIVDKVKGQHYQVACGKYFEAKHKGTTLIETELGGIMHPNQFFEESAKFYCLEGRRQGRRQGRACRDHRAAAGRRRGGRVELARVFKDTVIATG